jgi:hypothetical protein
MMWVERTKSSCFLSVEKRELESSPNILVTKIPNWSKNMGKGTDCVNRRY